MNARPSRRIDQPEEGYFKMRLVRGGPFVAARIWRKGDELHAHVNGFPCPVSRVWEFARDIGADEYKRLMSSLLVASEACDLRTMPGPF